MNNGPGDCNHPARSHNNPLQKRLTRLQLQFRSLLGLAIWTFKNPGILPPGFSIPTGWIFDTIYMLDISEVFGLITGSAVQPYFTISASLQEFSRV
ncbi:MAG TPA: hypothetical protein VJ974_05835 [Geopsychrobacteraceae bacterium]|nr:hypothetical protein [Geopsychrobacteraceae bacterium]